tara:strand:- start:507 stop:827 length:321 start_codon:yes stop_codon:yes gene_type:complete
MIVVNSDSTTHTTKVVPRFIPTTGITLELYNETTRQVNTILFLSNSYAITDGVLMFSFSFTFAVDSKYQVKITEGANVVFRGKLIAIDQSTQQYDPTDGLYTYSTI